MIADNKLFAEVIACISPVKCKLISSIGATCEYPPPVAPPLIPNTGPKDGSLNAATAFFPILFKPSTNPIETVVFPSPNGVGFIEVTKISFPSFFSFNFSNKLKSILALYFPYCSKKSSSIFIFSAILLILSNLAFCAISISLICINLL